MFNLLNIGRSALLVSEQQINTTAHNIANIYTPGFSRQRVIQQANTPIGNSLGNYGTGAEMVRLERMRDQSLDVRYWNANSRLGTWEKSSQRLSELETNLLEPGDYGLSAALNEFWDRWEDVADNPDGSPQRQEVMAAAQKLARAFNNTSNSITSMRQTVNQDIEAIEVAVNSIGNQLAELNMQIHLAEGENRPANDLRDRFDLLIDELSHYGDTCVQTRQDGSMVVYFGSDEFVKNDQARQLTALVRQEGCCHPAGQQDGDTYLVWNDTRIEVAGLNNGEIIGLAQTRDNMLTSYQANLDNLATELASQLNEIHRSGYGLGEIPPGGHNFFLIDETDEAAAHIRLNQDLLNHPEYLAASLTGAVGDNQIALQIAELRDAVTMDGDQTFSSYFGGLISQVGSDTAGVKNNTSMHSVLTVQSSNYRESVKGVSLDEESANLIKYQQSFQAAAKIVALAEDLIQTVINMA
ncbi:MAG: flagellar hook-associated protein FlgK [Candidatus Cloacimonetes bacterium]|nr:flagellar hook-associated protein FlgK [Candidatus Cloacimonadota bacterium]